MKKWQIIGLIMAFLAVAFVILVLVLEHYLYQRTRNTIEVVGLNSFSAKLSSDYPYVKRVIVNSVNPGGFDIECYLYEEKPLKEIDVSLIERLQEYALGEALEAFLESWRFSGDPYICVDFRRENSRKVFIVYEYSFYYDVWSLKTTNEA